ncbi:tetratricopeptide repeat protein [bacterium]|nr:tetratricopeptide repeat protein [bacterium]
MDNSTLKLPFHLHLSLEERFAVFLLLCALLLLVSSISVQAAAIDDLAEEGDIAYRKGEYENAIEAYRIVLDSGYTGGKILYNLGNAFYKNGDLAEAILYYERALRERPHDHDVRHNLELARTQTVDKIESPPRLPIWKWVDALRDLVAPRVLAWWSWIWASITALFFAAILLLRFHKHVRLLKTAVWISLIIFLLPASLLTLRVITDRGPEQAIVMTEKIVVRSAPDPGASEVFHLHEGTKVTILKSLEDYREVQLEDGRQGWLRRQVVATI